MGFEQTVEQDHKEKRGGWMNGRLEIWGQKDRIGGNGRIGL